jgi:DNA-binding transcriptional regulator YhcF (GntR family)
LKWNFTEDRPIYSQIVEQIQVGILRGAYPPGSGMPSVRVLALEAEVNPNTMQKALAELETMGLLHTQRTAGRTVTEDGRMIEGLKRRLAEECISRFFFGMEGLGIGREEAIGMLRGAVSGQHLPEAATAPTKEVN